MKLIFCKSCRDVFKLEVGLLRTCHCGLCVGRYEDNGRNAVVNGQGVSLAIENHSLVNAIYKNETENTKQNVKCWVRSHEGALNPRTKVDASLKAKS